MSINEGPRSASHFISEVADGALAAQLSGELHRMRDVFADVVKEVEAGCGVPVFIGEPES